MNTYAMSVVYVCLIAFALTPVINTTSIFATHSMGVADYEWHIWSRSSTDGHLGHLACDSNNDHCALKIKTIGPIQSMSQSVVNDEVDAVEYHFDSLGKKMSIDRRTSADSYITAYNLPVGMTGKTVYELHCTNKGWRWCNSEDMHFEKMTIQINNNPSEVKFNTYENSNTNPKIYDVRKTLGHELFHAMGIDHNSASNSIVYYTYVFGANNGYVATTADKNDLGGRYPGQAKKLA